MPTYDRKSTFEALKELAKKYKIEIVTAQQPRPLGRPAFTPQEPQVIIVDYLPSLSTGEE
jgi:hypothetical protein